MLLDNTYGLQGKRVLVTGASSGIGRDIAISLSKLGVQVIALGRDKNRLEESLANLVGHGHSSIAFDLRKLDGIGKLIDDIVLKSGVLYGIVHSAGINHLSSFRNVGISRYKEIFDVNIFSFVELVKGLSKRGNYEGCGSIVGISSVMAKKPGEGAAFYSSSKAALDNMIKTMALELINKKIRVNSVVPSYVDTEMLSELKNALPENKFEEIVCKSPLGLGKTADISSAVIFLLGNASNWITGTNLVVDGGYLLK